MSLPIRQSAGAVRACGSLLRTVPRVAPRVVPIMSIAPRTTTTLGVRTLSTSPVQLKKKDKGAAKDKGKGKKKAVQEEDEEDEGDFPAAKGKGKGKPASSGPQFDMDSVQDKLQHVLNRAQTTVKELLSRVGRPDPSTCLAPFGGSLNKENKSS